MRWIRGIKAPKPPFVIAATFALLSCGGDPWAARGAPKVPPDEQFRTGVEAGDDVFVWHCYEGARVVIAQSGSACFGTSAPSTYRGTCGAPLSIETRWSNEHHHGIPDGSRWPGSKPDPPEETTLPDASPANDATSPEASP